ncbi:MAG TPA: lysine--tRNA ligase [Kiritimatiellia bacterium]|nr:lysine--tRNA ligase [Kiritimatiellia bacterium]HMO97655.1 lysine--tRNA ligase [Kiritimatiellia bacterium]HMP95516.1 lysine--tRNA ligase [Kiritimatiellia bacterium]
MEHGPHEDEFRRQRLANLEALKARGIAPYGKAFPRDGRIADLRAGFAENRVVRMSGRLMTMREMGKSIFADVNDGSGRFQVYVRKNDLGDDAFSAFQLLDLGDVIGIEGEMFTTKMGEPTVKVNAWTLLSKSLLPLPEKWHGLQDVDTRYRKRYLDLIANPEVRKVFDQRIAIVREIRACLHERGFQEVETPMMQPMAGGAAANPFKTHYEALNCDMFLRIAPELYLKRLMVGGFDKVFELNRNFRNEGLSRFHNPEFTMIEVYQAYGDMRTMMDIVQDMILRSAREVIGSLQVGAADQPVNLTPPWREVTYHELVREAIGEDWFDLDLTGAKARAHEKHLHIDPAWTMTELTQEVFEKLVEKTLIDPTFVTRLPAALVPLAKPCDDDPSLVDVFELVIGGREIAPGYSELNDPLIQRARFLEQAGGDAAKIDEDFLTALEHGMPPAGGMGVGIDRLVMVLTGAESIRDVILFPQLKPRT